MMHEVTTKYTVKNPTEYHFFATTKTVEYTSLSVLSLDTLKVVSYLNSFYFLLTI